MLTTKVLTLAAAMLIAGCAVPNTGPRAALHGASTLQAQATLGQVAFSPASWPVGNWWERYDDPQLNSLICAKNPGSGLTFRHGLDHTAEYAAAEGSSDVRL